MILKTIYPNGDFTTVYHPNLSEFELGALLMICRATHGASCQHEVIINDDIRLKLVDNDSQQE